MQGKYSVTGALAAHTHRKKKLELEETTTKRNFVVLKIRTKQEQATAYRCHSIESNPVCIVHGQEAHARQLAARPQDGADVEAEEEQLGRPEFVGVLGVNLDACKG